MGKRKGQVISLAISGANFFNVVFFIAIVGSTLFENVETAWKLTTIAILTIFVVWLYKGIKCTIRDINKRQNLGITKNFFKSFGSLCLLFLGIVFLWFVSGNLTNDIASIKDAAVLFVDLKIFIALFISSIVLIIAYLIFQYLFGEKDTNSEIMG